VNPDDHQRDSDDGPDHCEGEDEADEERDDAERDE
jgi:hypothetical protein